MRRLDLAIVDELAGVLNGLCLVTDLVAVEMRALAHAADEMQVRAVAAERREDAPEPASVAKCHTSVGLSQSPTYYADGADLEYG